MYLILDFLYSILFPEHLSQEQLQFLANVNITELRCGERSYSTKKVYTNKGNYIFMIANTDHYSAKANTCPLYWLVLIFYK